MLAEYRELAAGFAQHRHATAHQGRLAGNLATLGDLDLPAGEAGIACNRRIDHHAAACCIEVAAHPLGNEYSTPCKQCVPIDGLVQVHLRARNEGIAFHGAAGRSIGSEPEVVARDDGFVRARTPLFRCLADRRSKEQQE